MQVCKHASMQVGKYASIQLYKYASRQVSEYASMQICKCASVEVTSIWKCLGKKCRKANIQSICPLLCTLHSSSTLAYFHTCILVYLHTCILVVFHFGHLPFWSSSILNYTTRKLIVCWLCDIF